MVLPLIITWDRDKMYKSEFLRQLYVVTTPLTEPTYLSMAGGLGVFGGGSRISVCIGGCFTTSWSTMRGDRSVYKPLGYKGVS